MDNDSGYLRGREQGFNAAYRMALKGTTPEEIRSVIGFAVDEAENCRNSGEGSFSLLDDIARAAYKKHRESSDSN